MMNTASTSLSVIIPVYNKEAYLSKCLDSILKQQYAGFEVIVIDDGSKDRSLSVIRHYEQMDPRIHSFSYPNGGVSVARNRGIEKAQGEFILFIDSDDWIEDDYFSMVIDSQKQFKADMVLWGLVKEYDDGKKEYKKPSVEGVFDRQHFLETMIPEQYGKSMGILGYVPNKLVRRELLLIHNIRFNPQYKLQEDYDFYLQCYEHCNRFACISYCGYHYVTGTAFSSNSADRKVDYLSLLDIQSRCAGLVVSTCGEKSKLIKVVDAALADLAIASLLELRDISYRNICSLVSRIHQRRHAVRALCNAPNARRILNNGILNRKVQQVYVYTWLWNKYLKLRGIR